MTSQRLTGTRFTDIHRPLSWTFTGTTVVIENEGEPIPADVVEVLVGSGPMPVRIAASWRLDEEAKTLCLFDVKADEASFDKDVTIPIAPAGHVRVNLGTRQYNMFRERAKGP